MLRLAICVVAGALARTESRGAHFREDFPRRDDRAWLRRTLAFWRGPDDTLPTFDYETLDVTRMELPPGWRGYGGKATSSTRTRRGAPPRSPRSATAVRPPIVTRFRSG